MTVTAAASTASPTTAERFSNSVVAAPLAVWFAGRLVGLAVLAIVAVVRDRSMLRALTAWDGNIFLRIAEAGYPGVPAGLVGEHIDTSMAFFPGYPLLIRAVGVLSGLELTAAGLAITASAGAALAIGLAQLARQIGMSRRSGLLWVGLAGSSPLSVVFVMTYTEALFCALAVWALVLVMRRQWPVAALLAIAAGATRPTGLALIAVVAIGALLEGWRAECRRRAVCVASAAAAPVGLLGYLTFVAVRSHSLTGWFQIQQVGWNTHIDGGKALIVFIGRQLTGPWTLMETATVAVVLSLPILIWATARIRVPWQPMLYALVVVGMAILSDGVMNSKIRMLLPALPLLLPIATGLAQLRASTQVAVIAGATLVSSWFGAYCLLIYTHAI